MVGESGIVFMRVRSEVESESQGGRPKSKSRDVENGTPGEKVAVARVKVFHCAPFVCLYVREL